MKIKSFIQIFLVFIFVMQIISSLSIEEFFQDLKNSPENYYVLCDSENLEIISKAKSFADYFEIGFSNEMLENKNPLAIVIPPSFMGYFYYFENQFSYVESKQTPEINLLVLYFSNSSNEKVLNEMNFIFSFLKSHQDSEENYFIFNEDGKILLETFNCQGFINTSIFEKNIFNHSGVAFEDQCLDEKTLLKMECVSELKFNSVVCEKSCNLGKCVDSEVSIFSLVKRWTLGKNVSFKRIFELFKLNFGLFVAE